MGRTMKRVPMDFAWPLGQIWKGYLNPYDPVECPKCAGEECPLCNGTGHLWCDEKYEDLYENWEPIDPPTGEGYQLWETTSEGSPISPIFKSIEELAAWCETGATVFASYKATKDDWLKMFQKDFVHHQEGHMVFM